MNYNIVEEYDWTSLPKSARKHVPKVYVQSYIMDTNQLYNALNGYIQVAKDLFDSKETSDKYYSKLYKGKESDHFLFPYFDDNIRSFGNTFYDNLGNSLGSTLDETVKTGIKMAADVANAIQNRGSSSLDLPKHYQFDNTDAPLKLSFPLYNTITDESYNTNRALVNKLTEINRPTRIDSVTMTPPRIYKIILPGYRLIRWAYCSDFGLDMLGTRRMIGEELIPEAYNVSMSFTSLVIEQSKFVG